MKKTKKTNNESIILYNLKAHTDTHFKQQLFLRFICFKILPCKQLKQVRQGACSDNGLTT